MAEGTEDVQPEKVKIKGKQDKVFKYLEDCHVEEGLDLVYVAKTYTNKCKLQGGIFSSR